ncbi:hypothetical protein F2Q69_00051408 [Brassica cretica]|uniref:Uncharacterized protein n=1 Tax=Brassica cretica TaxID=69181 RepID=A0A8S9Q319_BRACR|nr:hypothetical protein F2Q69_00051408 [Brassica cretica]
MNSGASWRFQSWRRRASTRSLSILLLAGIVEEESFVIYIKVSIVDVAVVYTTVTPTPEIQLDIS